MAQNVPNTRTYKDIIGLTDGVNSYLDPQFLKETEVRWAENAVNKGGIWQTRPGFDSIVELAFNSTSGDFYTWYIDAGMPKLRPQFFTVYKPINSDPQFVFGVNGAVFYCIINSDGTIDTPKRINQIQLANDVDYVCAVQTIQTADLINGVVYVIPPRSVLFIQDGVSRAAYWNGNAGGHLNPTKRWDVDALGNAVYVDGFNQTRIGQWMAWSGNRLWVACDNQVFASDLNDPFHFTDETVLTKIPSFTFPTRVTGLVDRGTSGVQQNLMFVGTEEGIFTLWSGILDRTLWATAADFQRKVFAGVGCASHKSMISHMGLLYWYSTNGVVAFDSLGTVTSTQAIPPIDSELAYSKKQMGNDRIGICAGKFDSYVWWSVPVAVQNSESGYSATYNGKVYNGHTQVLDRLVTPATFYQGTVTGFGQSSWQGVWTGLRPIEWSSSHLNGKNRVFCLSLDYDGVLRIWEAFNGNRADNNQPIDWAVETKAHAVTENPFSKSIFRHFRLLMAEVYGNLSIKGYWKGLRGPYHQLLDTSVAATPGSVLLNNSTYFPMTTNKPVESFSKQTRDILSEDNRSTEECTSVDVESRDQDDIDRAFSLLFRFTGIGAVKAYRLAVDFNPDITEGQVTPPETGQHILPENGCPKYISGPLADYNLVKRDSKDVLMPVESRYIETGYQLPRP